MTGDLEADSGMAHFDTEYQRLEASYSDSPPGEENLLVHVPEGSKCKIYSRSHIDCVLTVCQSHMLLFFWHVNLK